MIELNFDQGSIEWHEARQGKVTGTSLASVMGSKKVQDTLMYKLISERMTDPQIPEWDTEAVKRGREMEPIAVAAISEYYDLCYEVCGFLVSEEFPMFGFSPDAVYKENGIIIGGAETKCPNSNKHVEYLLKDEIPKEYYWQVIAPFICCDDIQWWDFVSYDDRNYDRPLFTVRVKREKIITEVNLARKTLGDFLDKVREAHEGLVF